MLEKLFPNAHNRYASLPLLGPVLDDFARWLLDHGYLRSTVRVMLSPVPRIDRSLRRRGVRCLTDIDAEILRACWTAFHRRGPNLGGLVRALSRYLDTRGLLRPQDFTPRSPAKIQLAAYTDHLKHVRGCSSATVANHVRTASSFLDHVGYDAEPGQLEKLTQADIESFIIICSKRLVRSSMQQAVAHLRSFMRFLALKGETAAGREIQIDTSRLYRQEQLPRSLPWDTVRALLQSIDCTTPVGLRDYAMLFLIASYGLRASEIAHLTLDDFHWREGQLQVPQRKTGTPVVLPLTDSVVSVLMHYLREGRPTGVPRREVFLRIRAPIGPLTPTAVSMVFKRWARRSGLKIPSCGAHCLRHSYAVHLLRGGISLKTIGDLLGHRNAESTCAYLRLATEDLRAVALPLPDASKEDPQQEVQS